MEWLKATGLAVLITVLGLGIFIGAKQFLSGSEADEAKMLAQQKVKIAAAKDLLLKSPNSKADPGQLAALQLLRKVGEKLDKLSLGCINAKGMRINDNCIFFSKIDLSASDGRKPFILSGSNLSGANFLQSNLSWVDFKSADLKGANLSAANLYRTNFEGANLFQANLSGADLLYTALLNANISSANMAAVKNLRQERLNRACLGNPGQPPLNLPAGLIPPTKKCR
jgi:uncharacterized protein YjbI with pentapeptide repeats